MQDGLWDDYEDEEQKHTYDRGPVTSELEISDSKLREVEEVLSASPDDAFDRYRDGKESPRVGNGIRGTTGTENGEVVLESFRDISAATLAHESVHGFLRQPDQNSVLPGDDYFEHELYEETVAILAESEINSQKNCTKDLRDLKKQREKYLKMREKEDVITDDFESLYDDTLAMDNVLDEEVLDLKDQRDAYQVQRKTVLAREAANHIRTRSEVEIESLVNPDEQQYDRVMSYLTNIEKNLEDRL